MDLLMLDIQKIFDAAAQRWADKDDATIAMLEEQIASLGATIDKSTDTIIRLNEAWDKARDEAERWKTAYDIAHDQATDNGSRLLKALAESEQHEKGIQSAYATILKLREEVDALTPDAEKWRASLKRGRERRGSNK